jgi:hypothetical protein
VCLVLVVVNKEVIQAPASAKNVFVVVNKEDIQAPASAKNISVF